MWALLLAIALLILTHGRMEGTCKLPGILDGLTCAKFGRLCMGIYSHRPNRIYFKFSIATA